MGKERNVLFNDALNTLYLRLYGVRHMVNDHSDSGRGNRCRHMGYSFRLTARVLLYAPSHRQDNTYHGLCYTSRRALAGTRNSSMASFHVGSIPRPIAPLTNALTMELNLVPVGVTFLFSRVHPTHCQITHLLLSSFFLKLVLLCKCDESITLITADAIPYFDVLFICLFVCFLFFLATKFMFVPFHPFGWK